MSTAIQDQEKDRFAEGPDRSDIDVRPAAVDLPLVCSVSFAPTEDVRPPVADDPGPAANAAAGKLARLHYRLAAVGLAFVVVLHFVFQFSLIRTEDLRLMQDLTRVERFERPNAFSVPPPDTERDAPAIVPETTPGQDVAARDETEEAAEPVRADRRTRAVTRRERPRRGQRPVRSVTRKKKPQETRTERLRRAERILTGA